MAKGCTVPGCPDLTPIRSLIGYLDILATKHGSSTALPEGAFEFVWFMVCQVVTASNKNDWKSLFESVSAECNHEGVKKLVEMLLHRAEGQCNRMEGATNV